MSDAQIYLTGERKAQVAAAKRRMDTKAFRDGLISREQWKATIMATDAQLLADRDTNWQEEMARQKAIIRRKEATQRRLTTVQELLAKADAEAKKPKKSPRTTKPK